MDNLIATLGIAVILLVLLLIAAHAAFCLVPASMAKKRGRSWPGWFWLSFLLLSPLFSMFILLCLGETDEKRKQRIMDEEALREHVRQKIRIEEETREFLRHKPATHQQSTPESDYRQRGEEHARYQPTTPEKSINPSAKTVGDMYKQRY